MTLEATDIERQLRANRDAFVLKEHVSGKSEAWKHFSCCWSPVCKRWTVCIVPCIKPFLPIMDSHRVGSGRVQEAGNISGSGHDFRGSGRVLKFGPACNSAVA